MNGLTVEQIKRVLKQLPDPTFCTLNYYNVAVKQNEPILAPNSPDKVFLKEMQIVTFRKNANWEWELV